jgi:MFS family permease
MEQLSTSGAAIAHLVWSVMLPKTIFAPLGGYLADRHDRRQLMMILDLVGAVVVLGYVVAVQRQSLPLLYITTMLRSTLSSLYYPATTGIVPMLVPNAKDLQLAVTMNGWAWSTMAIFGGALAGAATAIIGLQACYVIDCFTFLLSAGIVYAGVKGNYRVNGPMALGTDANHAVAGSVDVLDCTSKSVDSPKAISFDAAQQVATYLMTCGFGWLVLMKASAGLVWGPEDVIGVQFATVRAASDGLEEDVSATSRRTGLLFSVIGIGMLIGPTMSNFWTDANFPRTLQRASWLGLVVLTVGWILISLCGNSFPAFMVCTIIRTMGSGMVWVNSTVTLQALTDPSFLGRVLAIEYTTYTLAEAFSATITGELFDAGLDKNQLSLVGAALGLIMASCWGKFHWSGCGAAQPRFNSAANGGGINKDLLHSSLELSTILDEMAVPSCQDLELGSLDGSLATVGWPEPSAE